MRNRVQIVAIAILIGSAGAAYAQSAGQDKRPAAEEKQRQLDERKQALQKQREEMMQSRKDELQKQREQMKQQHDQMLGQRQELMEQLRDFQKQLREQVTAGQLTKEQARDQLNAWRKDHKPATPDRTKPTRPSNAV